MIKEVQDGLVQAVNKFRNEVEALQLDIKQNKELQQQFADLHKRYIDSAQVLEGEIEKLSSSIESGMKQASSKVDEIEQKIRGLYASADAADKDAIAALKDSADFAAKSQEERRRIALSEFGNKYQFLSGANPEKYHGLDSYIEDPLDHWDSPNWTPVKRAWGFDLISGLTQYREVKGQNHVDNYWSNWQLKTQESQSLFAQAKTNREEAAELEQLKAQWEIVSQISNDSKKSIKEIQRLLAVDAPAVQEETAKATERLQNIQNLLPTLNQRLEMANRELQSSQAKLDDNWKAFSASADVHLQTVYKALNFYSQWESSNLEYQEKLDGIEAWSEQQGNTLVQKTNLLQALGKSLQERLSTIEAQLPTVEGDERDTLEHQKTTLQQALQLVGNVSNVFELQKGSLKNLQQLEESHESISLTEQQLMRDYVSNPDSDGQVLEKKLELAHQTLAETDRLAKQAEDSSNTLYSSILDFKNLSLEAQNQYIQATQQLQPSLDDLRHAIAKSTQSARNLENAQENLKKSASDIKQVLDEAVAAGDREAAALRDVANYQGMETAAQLYARDFRDLAGGTKDKGMRRIYGSLLEKYDQDAQYYKGLKAEADANAETAQLARTAAEAAIEPLKKEQEKNQSEINNLRTALNNDLGDF